MTRFSYCLWTLVLLTPAFVRGESLLRWKLVPGETLAYEFKQSTQTETAGAGKQMRIAMDTAMTVSWKIESVDQENLATIVQAIDQFSIKMTADKLDPIIYDSTAKTAPTGPAREIADGVRSLIGATCRIQMSHRGEIVSVEPSAELKKAMEASGSQSSAGQAASLLKPEGVSRMLRQAAVILPEKPIAEGASWEATQESPISLGTVQQRSRFTYTGTDEREGKELDKITVETTFSLGTGASSASATKLKEGRQSGTLWFDSSAGRFISSELTQRLVTERPYRESTIRVQSTSTLAMTLRK